MVLEVNKKEEMGKILPLNSGNNFKSKMYFKVCKVLAVICLIIDNNPMMTQVIS